MVKRVQSVLFGLLVGVLLISGLHPVHAAAGDPAYAAMFEPVFGMAGALGDLYQSNPQTGDAILVAILFITLGISIIGKKFESKAAGTVVGLILTFGFVMFERTTGWSFAKMDGIVAIIVILVMGGFVYNMLEGFFKDRFLSFSLAYLLMFGALTTIGLEYVTDHVPKTVYSVMNVVLVIATIGLLIRGFAQLRRALRGEGGSSFSAFGSPSPTLAAAEPMHKAAQAEEKNIGEELTALTRQSQQNTLAANARAAEVAELQQLGAKTATDAGVAAQEVAEAQAVTTEEQQLGEFAKATEAAIDQAAHATPTEQQALVAQIDAQKPALQQEMQRIAARLTAFANRLQNEQTLQEDAKLLQTFEGYINQQQKAVFDAERKLGEQLERAEQIVRSEWQATLKEYKKAEGKTLAGPAQAFTNTAMQRAEEQLQQHLPKYTQLRQLYDQMIAAAEEIGKTQMSMRDLLDKRTVLRKQAHELLAKLADEVPRVNDELAAGIDLRSHERLEKAIARKDQVVNDLKNIQQGEISVYQVDASLNAAEQKLLQLVQFRDRNEPILFTQAQQTFTEQDQLVELLDAAETLVSVASESYRIHPTVVVDRVALGMNGFRDFTNKNFTQNNKTAEAIVARVIEPMQTMLSRDANESIFKEQSVYQAALGATIAQREQLVKDWKADVQKRTLENERQKQGIDQTGFSAWAKKVGK